MFRIILIILILLPTISNADQGLNISCLNMKSMYGKKYEPLKFTLAAVGFQYFDKEKDELLPGITLAKAHQPIHLCFDTVCRISSRG